MTLDVLSHDKSMTVRPWKPWEIPIGAWIRYRHEPWGAERIESFVDGKIYDSTRRTRSQHHWEYTPETAMLKMEWSHDKSTWYKCGKYEH